MHRSRKGSRRVRGARPTAVACAFCFIVMLVSCSENSSSTFGDGPGDPTPDAEATSPRGNGPRFLEGDAAARFLGAAESGATAGCATLSGTVYTPGATDPLYNAVVFVAAGDLAAPASGASCDKCGSLSGSKAIAATLSGADGKFRLTGVPLGTNVPLVIQLGKWRRVVPITVASCGEMALSAAQTRLPRDHTEGNIPLTAISTGGADSLECILRKMGVADGEFTTPHGGGRIHLYRATGASGAPGPTPLGWQLWSDPRVLDTYDVVLLPCEGEPTTDGKMAGFQNLVDYTARGGRVFITHYDYTWIRPPTAAFPATATWTEETKYFGEGYDYPVTADIDLSFPKGRDFAAWLRNVGASGALGQIELHHVVRNADGVIPDVAQSWLYSDPAPREYAPGGAITTQRIVHQYTFNTPVGAPPASQCGRVVYSAFHVNDADSGALTFPQECSTSPLSPQEKALMFMFFDLSSCVQTDREPPVVPIIN